MSIFTGILIFFVLASGGVFSLDSEVVVLRAIRGRDARLPCGQGKVFLDGPHAYVLWLKNDQEFLYRYPNEETERRIVNRELFGTSCVSGICHDGTSLLLKEVGDKDAGLYRCRVHYQASPSLDYVIEVRLVGAPGAPHIYNGVGTEITNQNIGPLSLGSDITLICEVNDDQPETLVYWRRNGVVIEKAHSVRPKVLRAEVRVKNATRNELDTHYECLSQNADVSEPLIAAVVIKMYMAPIKVEIRLNNNLDFEAGQPRVVDCVVVGCVPTPSITWHLGDTLLRPSVHKELNDGNFTVSSLTLAPSLRDNQHELVCRAHNMHLPSSIFEDKVKLNIGFRPICVAVQDETVGVLLNDTEMITCVVEALPPPMQFSWTFPDSKVLYTNVKVTGHQNRYSSSLTWRTRDADVGKVHCRATNAFGEQKRPCAYTLTPGGPPRSPQCTVTRTFLKTVAVQCQKAWDGGRSQIVHLELFSSEGKLLHNVSNPAGHFSIPDDQNDGNMTAVVYASNIRGRSQSKRISLQTSTLYNSPAVLLQPDGPQYYWKEIVAGAVATISSIVALILCMKIIQTREYQIQQTPDLVNQAEGMFHREPDVVRDDRATGSTNITVNQLASCSNQYTRLPVPLCRVLVHAEPQQRDELPAQLMSYYV